MSFQLFLQPINERTDEKIRFFLDFYLCLCFDPNDCLITKELNN